MSDIDLDSMMSVLAGTKEDERGIYLPGEAMLDGKPVRAEGVKLAQLQTDGGMLQQWYDSIKVANERTEIARNQEAISRDVPDLIIGGKTRPPEDVGAGEARQTQTYKTIEEELSARLEDTTERWAKLCERGTVLSKQIAEAEEEVGKLEAALIAIGGDK